MKPPNAGDAAHLDLFLVENDADTRKFLSMYLEALGHVVRSAETVAQARADLRVAPCDALLVDISLADGTGWDLLRLVEEDGATLPFCVAMSGFGADGDRARSRAAGFRHHLVKPVDGATLRRVLAEAASERR